MPTMLAKVGSGLTYKKSLFTECDSIGILPLYPFTCLLSNELWVLGTFVVSLFAGD
jgi:hypothetical protein